MCTTLPCLQLPTSIVISRYLFIADEANKQGGCLLFDVPVLSNGWRMKRPTANP
jgi:hypothetical protein